MKRSDTPVSQPRWCNLRSAALVVAAVAVIGLTTMTPAKADWRDDWHRNHDGVGFGFAIGTPGYGYYPHPAYAPNPYGYPYYYGGYYSYDNGPPDSLEFDRR
jgi:hypothetical protein